MLPWEAQREKCCGRLNSKNVPNAAIAIDTFLHISQISLV